MYINSYKTIQKESKGTFKDKGSKFLAFAFPVINEEEVKSHISNLKREYHDARHHCYAYQIGTENIKYRQNDDGEPSGTAGKPIYGQILSFGLTNVLIVVVRYFGGILLGTSGLINAYRNAAKDCLINAIIIEKREEKKAKIHFNYDELNFIMKILKDIDALIIEQKFDDSCTFLISIPKEHQALLMDRLKKLENVRIEDY